MRKVNNLIFGLICFFLFSCNTDSKFSEGEKIIKHITIDFDSISTVKNDWHEFNLEKDEELNVTFSKGTLNENQYKITAKEYKSDSEPIIVALSSDTTGIYSFNFIYSNSSPGLQTEFTNGKSIEYANIIIQAKWKKYVPYIVATIVLFFGGALMSHLKTRVKFDHGYVQFFYPDETQIDLHRKEKVDLAKSVNIGDNVFCTIYCEKDSKFENDEEIEYKVPRIEVDSDMSIVVNGKKKLTNSSYLSDKDNVIILNSIGDEIIKLRYNEF